MCASSSEDHAGIEIVRDVNTGRLGWYQPESDDEAVVFGDFFSKEYWDLTQSTWRDAEEALECEEEFLEHVDPTTLELDDEWWEELGLDGRLMGLDLGVASTAIALSASHCITLTSCNGGVNHHEDHPLVVFCCRPPWVPYLLAAAEAADCGLTNETSGTVIVYADSVAKMRAFARELIARKTDFERLHVKGNHEGKLR